MSPTNPPPPHILFVDDNKEIQMLVAAILKSDGMTADIASSAAEGLKILESKIPDLILSDVMMAEMDGLTFLKELRARPGMANIPVILLTAMTRTEDIVKGLSLGADDYITKPFMASELLARIHSKINRPPMPLEQIAKDTRTGLLKAAQFEDTIFRECYRSASNGSEGFLAFLYLAELPLVAERINAAGQTEIWKQTFRLFEKELHPTDTAGWTRDGHIGLLLPDCTEASTYRSLSSIAIRIVNHTFQVGSERFHFTPSIGYTGFLSAHSADEVRDQALTALETSMHQLDLQPLRYEASMGSAAKRKREQQQTPAIMDQVRRIFAGLTLPAQILLTSLFGIVFPYFVYRQMDHLGHDITPAAYMIVTAALVITSLLIWVEGFLAVRAVDPPAEPKTPYPPATAIIAAYLPNEAATIVETVEAFLNIDYPAPLQIILAYNTPHELLVEKTLREIATANPRLQIFHVKNSTSKAQNVNKALSIANGKFIGVFDADHHPAPDSFTRAWRWLSHGTDVVQGHCVVRNGNASWISRMVAVEFEAIYAVSHPGRSIMHKFGIFGGSNGYWKTETLRKTRMHGFMLTEDIDSSIRIMTTGSRIISDPKLISRELAPTNLKTLWHQRMRWAQGWHQVSVKHLVKALRSKHLSLRQKLGTIWLLGWREIYPWISIQMFPIIAYWVVKFGGVNRIDWLIPIFVMTTLFTLSVAPGQAYFAYKLSDPEIHSHKPWFWFYLLIGAFFYTEYKNMIARVAQMKELFKERHWKVTPRMTHKSNLTT